MNKQNHSGFTIIELAVALAIVSILATLAIPSYQDYWNRVRRDDATHLLMLNAQRLQRCFTLEGVYNGSCITRPLSDEGYYALSIEATTNTFEITARAVAGTTQAKDTGCLSFVYDHTGRRSATGSESDLCW